MWCINFVPQEKKEVWTYRCLLVRLAWDDKLHPILITYDTSSQQFTTNTLAMILHQAVWKDEKGKCYTTHLSKNLSRKFNKQNDENKQTIKIKHFSPCRCLSQISYLDQNEQLRSERIWTRGEGPAFRVISEKRNSGCGAQSTWGSTLVHASANTQRSGHWNSSNH